MFGFRKQKAPHVCCVDCWRLGVQIGQTGFPPKSHPIAIGPRLVRKERIARWTESGWCPSSGRRPRRFWKTSRGAGKPGEFPSCPSRIDLLFPFWPFGQGSKRRTLSISTPFGQVSCLSFCLKVPRPMSTVHGCGSLSFRIVMRRKSP